MKIGSIIAEIFLIWTNVTKANIGSVIAEIFLIWINVARTNVALTNVTVTVGICSR